MPECVKKREPVLSAATLALRDLVLAPPSPPDSAGRSLFEGFLDDYYFLSRTYSRGPERTLFPRREGNVRLERAGVEYEMRATDLFKGQARHPVCRITL